MLWRFRKELILLAQIFLSLLILNKSIFRNTLKAENEKPARIIKYNYKEILEENKRLREILELQDKNPILTNATIGEVISMKPYTYPAEIIVNKGSKNGIQKNMVVISKDNELIGRIVEVKERTSKLITIFHSKSNISSIVQPSREIGIIEGGSAPSLKLKYITNESSSKIGDEVITSGYSSLYPKGIRIGKIVTLRNIHDDFYFKVTVNPFAYFSNLDEVIIGK